MGIAQIHQAYIFYEGESLMVSFLIFIGVVLHATWIKDLVRDVRGWGRDPVPWGIWAFFMSPVAWIVWIRVKNREIREGSKEGTADAKAAYRDTDLPVREWRFTKPSFSWRDVPVLVLLMGGFLYAVMVVTGARVEHFPGGYLLHLAAALVVAGIGLFIELKGKRKNEFHYLYTCPACRRRLPRTKERLTREKLLEQIGDRCPRCGHAFFSEPHDLQGVEVKG